MKHLRWQCHHSSHKIYWVIAGITFMTLLVSAGVRSTPGVLIIPLEQSFGWERSAVTVPLAVNLALYGLCGPFASAFMERYGVKRIMVVALILLAAGTSLSSLMQTEWQMVLFWGVIVGLGTGLTSSVLGAVVANTWFTQRKGLVVGIFTASGATGQLIFLPLFAAIAANYKWQAVVWTTSIASLLVLLLVISYMRSKPSEAGVPPYGAEDIVHEQTSRRNPFLSVMHGLRMGIRSKDFWLLASSFFICGLSTNGLIGTHFIPASIEQGIPEVRAATLLAIIGVFDIIGTVASGWFADRWDSRWLLFWYYGLRGLSLLLLPFTLGSSAVGLVLFIIFYGLDWVATVPPTVRLASENFGENSGVVFGWIWASHQLGAATAALGGGLLHSVYGNYLYTFLSAGFFCLVASGLVVKIRRNKPISQSDFEIDYNDVR